MKNFKNIVASICAAVISIGAFPVEAAYTVRPDFDSNKLIVTGTGVENEKVVFQILKKDKLFTDWTSGGNAWDFILWHDQRTVGEDETFQFDVPYGSELQAGEYSLRVVSNLNGASAPEKIKLVGTETYSQALTDMLVAAGNNDYSSFKACIDGGDGKMSPVGFDISIFNKISYEGTELNKYAAFVATDGAADFETAKHFDDEAEKRRSAYFTSFIFIEALKQGGIVTDIESVLADSSITMTDSKLWKDLCNCITDETEWTYFTQKLESFAYSIEDFDTLNQAIIEALVLTETRYADGNDIKNVIVTLGYGEAIGISAPSTKNEVYSALNGRDFADISKFIEAYEASKKASDKASSGSTGSSSGGGGSSVSVPIFPSTQTEGNAGKAPQLIKVPFVDIEGVSWAAEAILALADKGIISGKGNNYFEPDSNVTREEFIKIIVCAAGLENVQYSKNNFTDVKDSDWFCKYVNIAYENGLVSGIGNSIFGAGDPITRQDMTVILCNALKYKGVNLPDSDLAFEDIDNIASYALSSVKALYAMGAVNGVSETQFAPLSIASRAQAAQIIYGVLKQLQ